MQVPEYRNARRVQNDQIDCEINHPDYGWIPFTANPADTGAHFDVAILYSQMADDPNTKTDIASPSP